MMDIRKDFVFSKKHKKEQTTCEENVIQYYKLLYGFLDYIFDEYKRKDEKILIIYDDQRGIEMSISEAVGNLILWYPNIAFSIPITRDDFYDFRGITGEKLNKMFERIVEKFIDIGIDDNKLSNVLSHMIEMFSQIAEIYSHIACNTFSLYDIIQFEQRNKEFANLLNTELNYKQMSIKDMENYLAYGQKEVIKIIQQDKKTSLYPYIQSGRLDKLQVTQMLVCVGPRADFDKSIVPRPIRRNFIKGLSDIGEYYVEAITARMALLIKHKNVRDSGYLSRKVNLLCLSTVIDPNVQDCGTKYYLTINVTNANVLQILSGKYMISDKNKLIKIDKTNTDLIGKTIKIRSHIYCALPEGRVCKTCYGSHHKTLTSTRIGGLPSLKIMNPLSQMGMSAKHKQTTKSTEITNEYIKQYFNIVNNEAYVKPEYLKNITKKNNTISILFNKESLYELLSDEESYDTPDVLDDIYIKVGENIYPLENSDVDFMLSEDIISKWKYYLSPYEDDDYYELPFYKLDTDTLVFNVVFHTEEVSRYLSYIKSRLDGSLIKQYSDIDTFVNDIVSIILESGLRPNITHLETIVYNLVKRSNTLTKRPDFSKDTIEPYVLLSISNSIKNKDFVTSLSFEDLGEQFKSVASFRKRGHSVFNSFFKVDKYIY